jgi:hypothetical protein
MDKYVVYMHNGVLFSHMKELSNVCRKMNGIGGHHVKQNIACFLSYAESRPKKQMT